MKLTLNWLWIETGQICKNLEGVNFGEGWFLQNQKKNKKKRKKERKKGTVVHEDHFLPIFKVIILTDQNISDFHWLFTFTKKEIS